MKLVSHILERTHWKISLAVDYLVDCPHSYFAGLYFAVEHANPNPYENCDLGGLDGSLISWEGAFAFLLKLAPQLAVVYQVVPMFFLKIVLKFKLFKCYFP